MFLQMMGNDLFNDEINVKTLNIRSFTNDTYDLFNNEINIKTLNIQRFTNVLQMMGIIYLMMKLMLKR